MVQQGVARRSHAEEKHAHLAVLLLAEASAPLTLHANTLRPVLDKARPVDHAHRADRRLRCRGHELFVEYRLDPLLHCLSLPRRDREEPLPRQGDALLDLRLVRGGTAKDQGHRLHALTADAQKQSSQISQCVFPALASPETRREMLVQLRQPLRRCAQFDRIHD